MAKNLVEEIDSLRRTAVRLLDRTLAALTHARRRTLLLYEKEREVRQSIAFVEDVIRDLGILIPAESTGGLVVPGADRERAVVNLGQGHDESASAALTPQSTHDTPSVRTIESELAGLAPVSWIYTEFPPQKP